MYTRVLYFARYSVPTLPLRRPRGGAKTFQHRSSERAVKPGKLLDATTQAGRVLAAAEIRRTGETCKGFFQASLARNGPASALFLLGLSGSGQRSNTQAAVYSLTSRHNYFSEIC